MEHQANAAETESPELNAAGKVAAQFLQYGANASNNLGNAFNNMSTKDWIRLIIIVGGYMLLRPYVLKHATKVGVKKLEAEEEKSKAKAAAMSPNELRGQGPGHVDDEDVGGDGTGADWGQKARVRQRQVLQQLMEAEEQRRLDEDELKEIEDLLED